MTTSPPEPNPSAPWQVRLLGDVSLSKEVLRVNHFPSRATAALLARLALWPQRAHGREELIELLWPGVTLDVGRNRLRQALSTLKSMLETGGGAPVLVADRQHVRVEPGRLTCDAVLFESAWRAGQVDSARAWYGGELMPGHFDDWIGEERWRLAALAERIPASSASARGPSAEQRQHVATSGPSPAANAANRPATFGVEALDVGAAPAYLTRLYGRTADLTQLHADVAANRLVTLLGPGGTGKTRLAAELAARLSGRAASPSTVGLTVASPVSPLVGSISSAHAVGVDTPFDQVRFVHLVSCHDRVEAIRALAATLGTEPALAAIERALALHPALLVLDNFEHLVESASDLVQSMLARLPQLHILITSRRALGLDGECERVLGALQPPSPDMGLTAAAANSAVAMFVDRARAARADFQLTGANLPEVLGLVDWLDAMPLALELAAARCRSLEPRATLALLQSNPLGLLSRVSTRADRDHRQASMERVVQWSWDLLPKASQDVLAALTVFRSGCTAEAAGAVCGLNALQASLQLDQLASHSLLQVQRTPDDGQRFRLLEVIRQFAAGQLSGERARELRQRMRQWLLDWGRVEGRQPVPSRIEPELLNVHAVITGAQADGASAQAMELALALRDYWELDGVPAHSRRALERLVADGAAAWPQDLQCDAHELLAYTSFGARDVSHALAHADQALALVGNDARRRGRCLQRRVWVCLSSGHEPEAQIAPLKEALALAVAANDIALHARCLRDQAFFERHQRSNLVRAEALYAHSQALWQSLGNSRLSDARLRNRAQCWAAQGWHQRALESFQLCEQSARAAGDWVGIIDSTLGAAAALQWLRRWPEAMQAGRDCLRVCWQRYHAHGLAYGLWNIPRPLLRTGRAQDAVRLMGFAAGYWAQHIGALNRDQHRELERFRRLARTQLDAQAEAEGWRDGQALALPAAVALALRD